MLAAIGEALPATAEEFAELERRLGAMSLSSVVGPVLQVVLSELSASPEYLRHAIEHARSTRPLNMAGVRDVAVAVGQGGLASVDTAYMLPPRPPLPVDPLPV